MSTYCDKIYVERHELGLFDAGEVIGAMASVDLVAEYDSEGLTGRGLYIGRRR
jgi:hypothetical protein